jgi:methylenetetrahydrofolate dehydrogenase (NADP+) / methenyltetrahydrofolate cyclohydrolase
MKSGTTAQIIDGKALAAEIQTEVTEQIKQLDIKPGLGVILVGDDSASKTYVNLKQKAAQLVGIEFCLYKFNENAREDEVLETINWLNKNQDIHAILIQLPLPKHLDEDKLIRAMNPKKDVDGFHPENIKAYLNDTGAIAPGLSLGIMQLLASTKENLKGKHALIIAKSEEFTSTLEYALNSFEIATTSCQPDDASLHKKLADADIAITAVGKPEWIKKDMIKDNAILIDVGTTRKNGKLIGDVDFESCKHKASWITPVPRGVGPMTVAMLLKNTVALTQNILEA